MKRIKILFTIPNFDTAGSGKALLNLATRLNPDRFEAEIMCLHNKGEFFKTVEDSGLTIHIHDFLPKERPIPGMLSHCFTLSKVFKKISPDVIHSFHYNSNYTEAIASRMAGIPWVFTKKNMSWGGASKNSWRLRSFFATKIIVQNTDMQRVFYPSSPKTVLIPRGVSLNAYKPDVPCDEIRKMMGTDSNTRIVICVANLVPVKGIEVLIKAFEKISEAFPQWKVWIIGNDSSPYANQLKQLVLEKQLNHKILFSGKQLDVKSFLDHAEIFVLPTKDTGEGSPVALLEAMANGKVVLGSDVPGIRDQLACFPDYLFQTGDEISLARKLEFLMTQDTYTLNTMGKNFQKHVETNFSLTLELSRHEKFYKSITE